MIKSEKKIEFGFGDILITPMVKEDFSKGCIVLQNQEPKKIGERISTDLFISNRKNDTVISFKNIESLDVLIENLQILKDMMSGNIKDCENLIEYNY